jgi:AcrR family transcriptional regulator
MATQAQRSAATRHRLLEAAVETLVVRGYHGTSTVEVGKRAGASRGAQLHHFPSKAELLGAAVEHVMARRHEELRAKLLGPRRPDLKRTFALLWEIYSGPTLWAWQELVVAARTDRELRARVRAVDARFTAEAEETFRAVFGLPAKEDVRAATRVLLSAFDGLAMSHALIGDEAQTRRALAELRRLIEPWVGARVRARRTT